MKHPEYFGKYLQDIVLVRSRRKCSTGPRGKEKMCNSSSQKYSSSSQPDMSYNLKGFLPHTYRCRFRLDSYDARFEGNTYLSDMALLLDSPNSRSDPQHKQNNH